MIVHLAGVLKGVASVLAVLRHPIFERARTANVIRREAPIQYLLPGGEDGAPLIVEGVLDLAFREVDASGKPAWTIVDYKTDRELSARRGEYETQVALYAAAVSAATGEPARGVLLSV